MGGVFMNKKLFAILFFTILSLVFIAPKTVKAQENVDTLVAEIEKSKNVGEGSSFDGKCLGWVATMYNRAYGWENISSCCARKNCDRWRDSTSLDVPKGAVVYFDFVPNNSWGITQGTCGSCNYHYGHIGIYLGNDTMAHVRDGAIYLESFSKVCGWPHYNYIGWGWMNDCELGEEKESEKSIDIPFPAARPDDNMYSSWGEYQTSTTIPTESDTLAIVYTDTTYHYFHYHNNYSGYNSMLDSVEADGYWGYCDFTTKNRITNTQGFQDKGGRTSISRGEGGHCSYRGYDFWFEDIITTYYYRTREAISTVTLEPYISESKVYTYKGLSVKLFLENANGKITWSSSDKNKGTVSSDGVVKALKSNSSFKVYANCDGKKYTCTITVEKTNPNIKLISKKIYYAQKEVVQVRTAPNNNALTRTKLTYNNKVTVVGSLKNKSGNLWYITSDGFYIYSKNLGTIEVAIS